jgi:hypothetical protein
MRSTSLPPRAFFARLASLAFACVLALTLVACDSNDDDGDDGDGTGDPIGSSSVNFSSGGTGFSGSALFATEDDFGPDDDIEGFSIILFRITSSDTLLVGIGREASAVPGAGTYPFADATGNVGADEFIGVYFEFTASSGRIGASTGGSFTIDSRSSDRLTGTFDMQGLSSDIRSPTAPPVSFAGTGTFDARRATQDNIDELDGILDDLGGF